jgi:hypothetical protein
VAAIFKAATAFLRKKSGTGFPRRASRRRSAAVFALCCGVPLLLASGPAHSASNKVRISNLSDVAFGTVANLGVDALRSQNVCLYADTATNGYNVTAAGTGPGGAFQLSSGPAAMSYEVQWSSSSGQSSGAQLTPNVPLTGQVSAATHQTCSNGPATSASLIVLLRSTALSSATAGTYNGTLTLVVGPE